MDVRSTRGREVNVNESSDNDAQYMYASFGRSGLTNEGSYTPQLLRILAARLLGLGKVYINKHFCLCASSMDRPSET